MRYRGIVAGRGGEPMHQFDGAQTPVRTNATYRHWTPGELRKLAQLLPASSVDELAAGLVDRGELSLAETLRKMTA